MRYTVNGRDTDLGLPDGMDFITFAKTCSSDQVIAMIGRCAALAYAAGCSDEDVQIVVNDVTLQIMAWRDPLMVNYCRAPLAARRATHTLNATGGPRHHPPAQAQSIEVPGSPPLAGG
jgi:hypothetical protein